MVMFNPNNYITYAYLQSFLGSEEKNEHTVERADILFKTETELT